MDYQTFETVGTIYLIHFDSKLAHSQHYIGFTTDLEQRLHAHANTKSGAKIMQAVKENGIDWELARTWVKPKAFERELKNYANSPKLCPICSGKVALTRKQ